MKTTRIALLMVAAASFVLSTPYAGRALVDPGQKGGASLDDGNRAGPAAREVQGIGFDITNDIRRAQEFLRDKTAGYLLAFEEKRVILRNRRGRKREKIILEKVIKPNFLLAVEDLKERRLRLVRVTDKGCVTQGFDVTKVRDNGVGSRFEVAYPENIAVLALRTLVRAGKNGHTEAIYTPYSPEIDTWQVRQAGLGYLTRQIALAYKDLREKNVRLSGFDRLLADVMPTEEISLVLSIIEHIDPVRFEHCQEGQEAALVREVLTVIGANTANAYAYSKSPAGARGLFQFIPKTYKRLQEKYPEAGLKKNFVPGCIDHVNAAKASLLLFDSDLSDLPKCLLSRDGRSAREIGAYLAAAYNCGAKRVGESARECGNQWTCHLPEETKIYLKKFNLVWELRKDLEKGF